MELRAENRELKLQLEEKDEQLKEKEAVIENLCMSSKKRRLVQQYLRLMQESAKEQDEIERVAKCKMEQKKRAVDSRYEKHCKQLDKAMEELNLEEEAEGNE